MKTAYKVVSVYAGRYFSSQMYFNDYLIYVNTGLKPWYFVEYKIGQKTCASNDAPDDNKDLFIYENAEQAIYDASVYSRPNKPLEAFECQVDRVDQISRCIFNRVRHIVDISNFCSEITLTKKLEKLKL